MNAELKQAVERLELFASMGATKREQYLSDQGWDDISSLLKAVREMGEDTKRLDWLDEMEAAEKSGEGRTIFTVYELPAFPGRDHRDIRKAIDAAMSNTKE